MKTERRHDLETNELALRVAHWIEKVKPYTGRITIAVLALVGLLAANSVRQSFSSDRQESAWDAFALANYTTDQELMNLQRVAEKEEYAGTRMQEWAYITWADRQLLLASQYYLLDRGAAEDRLRRISGIYEEWGANATDQQVRDRARFGLARVFEMQSKPEQARQQYALVQGDLQPLASERAKQLESERVQLAMSWLASAVLPRRDATGGSGASSTRPDFGVEFPSTTPGKTPLDTRSIEEILGVAGDRPDSDRYDQGTSSEDGTEATESAVEDSAVDVKDETTADQ